MVTINIAYTAPINPAGAEPALTQSQIWVGLKRKVRRAPEFVPLILSCEVLREDETEGNERVVREVRFADSQGPDPKPSAPIRETCVHYPPSRVDFQQENGSTISNIVSSGPDGELLMTYSFEWRHPEVEEGSAKAAELEQSHRKVSQGWGNSVSKCAPGNGSWLANRRSLGGEDCS